MFLQPLGRFYGVSRMKLKDLPADKVKDVLGILALFMYGCGWIFFSRFASELGMSIEGLGLSFPDLVVRTALVSLILLAVVAVITATIMAWMLIRSIVVYLGFMAVCCSLLIILTPYRMALGLILAGIGVWGVVWLMAAPAGIDLAAVYVRGPRSRQELLADIGRVGGYGLAVCLLASGLLVGLLHRADELAQSVLLGHGDQGRIVAMGIPLSNFDRIVFRPVVGTDFDPFLFGCGTLLARDGGFVTVEVDASLANDTKGKVTIPSESLVITSASTDCAASLAAVYESFSCPRGTGGDGSCSS